MEIMLDIIGGFVVGIIAASIFWVIIIRKAGKIKIELEAYFVGGKLVKELQEQTTDLKDKIEKKELKIKELQNFITVKNLTIKELEGKVQKAREENEFYQEWQKALTEIKELKEKKEKEEEFKKQVSEILIATAKKLKGVPRLPRFYARTLYQVAEGNFETARETLKRSEK